MILTLTIIISNEQLSTVIGTFVLNNKNILDKT